jgi:hypothetical protein
MFGRNMIHVAQTCQYIVSQLMTVCNVFKYEVKDQSGIDVCLLTIFPLKLTEGVEFLQVSEETNFSK